MLSCSNDSRTRSFVALSFPIRIMIESSKENLHENDTKGKRSSLKKDEKKDKKNNDIVLTIHLFIKPFFSFSFLDKRFC